MIPEQAIVEWRREAPWEANALVEQDLIISRALVEMYAVPEITERLAFRGGTALYKLHLRPAARYSEDIDLVQVRPEPIGATLDLVRRALDPWLGTPQRKLKDGRVNLVYRFESEDAPPRKMRLKIEINSREHFSELGLLQVPFEVHSQWFRGRADVTTFAVDELLGTKLRALYQRKKGRDLFDLWYAIERGVVNADALIACFDRCMTEGGYAVSRARFEANLHEKSGRPDFRMDMAPLLRPGLRWDVDDALRIVLDGLIARLPGDPWQGEGE
jgi:predicted nucleotidyltransferase component of viral defense system